MPGLSAPGEIIVDRWGIPHIYAATQPDAFRLQGFNAARDRLWQIDLWRRRGLGRLSAALGRSYVEQDRAARLFLYRGDLAREYAAYGDDARADRHRVRGGRQRLHRPGRARRRAAAGRVRGAGLPARALGGRGRRAHPQPRARLQPLRPGRPGARAARVRPQGRARCASGSSRAGATRSPTGSTSTPSPRTCSTSTSWRSRPSSSPSRRAAASRRPRVRQGSNNWAIAGAAHGDRPPDPRQRPAPDPGRAVAALPRAHRRPGPQRDRRGRAGAARHLDRPQRAHRVRPDDLRDRPGGPLRLRDARGQARTSTATATAGSR